jgi:hypothetical protein
MTSARLSAKRSSFPKPQLDRRTELCPIPLELIERLAALIAPPRLHRHPYNGVLAPTAPRRASNAATPPLLCRA